MKRHQAHAGLSAALVCDAAPAGGAVVLPATVRCVTPIDGPLIGPAATVEVAAGDNLGVHEALERCSPGDVLVVAAPDAAGAMVGELMVTYAARRGLAGIVTSGRVRDLADLRRIGLPVFAAGASPLRATKENAGAHGGAVRIGDAVVRPGDLIVGDADGIACLAAETADSVVTRALQLARVEAAALQAIEDGRAPRAALSAEQEHLA